MRRDAILLFFVGLLLSTVLAGWAGAFGYCVGISVAYVIEEYGR